MKTGAIRAAVVVMVGVFLTLGAPEVSGQSLYEQQLRGYSRIHDAVMAEKKEDHEKKRMDLEMLRRTIAWLKDERQFLREMMSQNEKQIQQLQLLDETLSRAQAQVAQQYAKLEILLQEQRSPSEQMKREISSGMRTFYQAALNSYRQQDEILIQSVAGIVERQKRNTGKIQEIRMKLEELGQ